MLLRFVLLFFLFTSPAMAKSSSASGKAKRNYKVYKLKVKSKKDLGRILSKYKTRIPSLKALKSLNKDKVKVINGKERIIVNAGDTFYLPISNSKKKTRKTSSVGSSSKAFFDALKRGEVIGPIGLYVKSGGGEFLLTTSTEEINQNQIIPYSFALKTKLLPKNKYSLRTEFALRPLSPAETTDGYTIDPVTEYYMSAAFDMPIGGFHLLAPVEYETINELAVGDDGSLSFQAASFASIGIGLGKDVSIMDNKFEISGSYNMLMLSDFTGSKIKGEISFHFTKSLSLSSSLAYYSLSADKDIEVLRYDAGIGYTFF